MTEFVHPALLFILGALPIPFLGGSIRKAYLLVIPVLAILAVMMMQPGGHGEAQVFGQEILIAKVDKLSIVFATVFTIMALIGMPASMWRHSSMSAARSVSYSPATT